MIKGKQQHADETIIRKDFDNINEIVMNKGMKSTEMTSNKKTNNISLIKQDSTSQVKQQISYELIHDNNYHTNLRKERYVQIEQSQQIKIPEPKDKEVENQTKKSESEENITYTTENTKINNLEDSTGKDGKKNIRVAHVEERIEDVVAVEMRNIQPRLNHKRMMK